MPDKKPPTPAEMIAAAINAMATDTVPPDYAYMLPVQYAVLMMAHATHRGLKAAPPPVARVELLAEAQLRLIEGMEDVRNGNRNWLFEPKPRPPGERKPKQAVVRRQAFCVVAIELLNETGKSFDDAAEEVVAALASWMDALAPTPATVLSWRRWIREEPEKHPEIVELYGRAKTGIPGNTLPERVRNLLTLISSADVF